MIRVVDPSPLCPACHHDTSTTVFGYCPACGCRDHRPVARPTVSPLPVGRATPRLVNVAAALTAVFGGGFVATFASGAPYGWTLAGFITAATIVVAHTWKEHAHEEHDPGR